MKSEFSPSAFREIPADQLSEINGGIAPLAIALVAAAVGAAVEAIIADWDNFKNGLQGLPEEKN